MYQGTPYPIRESPKIPTKLAFFNPSGWWSTTPPPSGKKRAEKKQRLTTLARPFTQLRHQHQIHCSILASPKSCSTKKRKHISTKKNDDGVHWQKQKGGLQNDTMPPACGTPWWDHKWSRLKAIRRVHGGQSNQSIADCSVAKTVWSRAQ